MSEEKVDLVNHPPHYNKGKYEHIVIVEAWQLGYHLGNATKYMMRAPYKGAQIQDLEKACWYLKRAFDCSYAAFVDYGGYSEQSIGSDPTLEEVATDWFGPDSTPIRDAFVIIGDAALEYLNNGTSKSLYSALEILERHLEEVKRISSFEMKTVQPEQSQILSDAGESPIDQLQRRYK